jgi:MFS family permease
MQQPGILVGLGSLGVVVVAVVAAAVPSTYPAARYSLLTLFLLTFAALVDDSVALTAVGAIGFLVFGGFIVDQLGELRWHGTADLDRLLVVIAAVSVGRLTGDAYRWYRRSRRHLAVSDVAINSPKEMRDA